MSAADFDVLPISDPRYDQYVQDYWNWLLSVNPDDKPVVNGVFNMRAWYNYINVIQDHTQAQRVNLPRQDRVHRVGTQQKPFPTQTSLIFLPMLDTLVHDNYYDQHTGLPFSPKQMTVELGKINDTITSGDINATIERIGSGAGPQSIVKDPHVQKIDPPVRRAPPDATFVVNIPANSTLGDKMEFIQPLGRAVNGRAQGFYALISIKTPGTYNIKSSGFGLRNYRAFMDYYIKV